MKNPVEFVKRELGYEPSIDQAKFLNDLADLENKNMIICAGRGAGKTMAVSWAVDWSMAVLPDVYGEYNMTILGGSHDQSLIMYRYFSKDIYKVKQLYGKLIDEPKRSGTDFEGGTVRALTASMKAVHGPHVELVILDEVCDADDEIIETSFPMVTGSKHGRTIMLSTPHKFFGIFQRYWDYADEYGFKKYGPWPMTNCSWIPESYIENMKIRYTPERFSYEVLGEFPKTGMQVFPADWIDNAITPEPFGVNPNYDSDIGVDWGRVHPSVATVFQWYSIEGEGLYLRIPGPEHIYEMMRYPEVSERIVKIYRNSRGVMVYGDKSHEGENQRLEDAGLNMTEVPFSRDKQKMIECVQWLLYRKQLKISPDNRTLIEQLKKYRWKPTASGKVMPEKKDDDCVDSLMLALHSVIHTNWYTEMQDVRNDMPETYA